MDLFLEPVDVWLFRDGRPFDALSDHRAESVFPPYPTVLQGAIRSHHLVVQGVDLRDQRAIAAAVGTADDFKDLRLRGPFLARRAADTVVRFLPQPADSIALQRDGRWTLQPAAPPQPPPATLLTSAPTPRLLGLADAPTKGRAGLWLAEADLRAYLRGEPVRAVEGDTLFCRESRLGIGINDARRTSEEGALYEADFIRPRTDVGLLAEVQGYTGWPPRGLLRLGGEARGASFEQVSALRWPAPPDPLPARFKLYFATPTFFRDGWRPLGEDWGAYFDGGVELVAAAVGRYESVGGFDLARASHKPARRYVPAGSVYYFESGGAARLRPGLVQQAVTDWGAAIGFGQILVEEWDRV
ncbi:MAG TPA: type III-B CRISPR module-associated Cmr3 family protein [Chloroflexota bacterium]|nr:type III-B CRISPR module-associated Cmr3 family protein [Chloroflexota bacterium]